MSSVDPTDEQIANWWRLMDAHRQRGGLCPVCRTPRRCRERAWAFTQLLVNDLLHRPRRVGRVEWAARYATRYGLESVRL
ncbi:hypothetical protein AB0B27_13865 [Micromonospora rifamycinica]|uniref:hypothetical protein n=1 Tax=Micromonospora rifamycinica TaxID=291594 RepID=UPI0033C087DC